MCRPRRTVADGEPVPLRTHDAHHVVTRRPGAHGAGELIGQRSAALSGDASTPRGAARDDERVAPAATFTMAAPHWRMNASETSVNGGKVSSRSSIDAAHRSRRARPVDRATAGRATEEPAELRSKSTEVNSGASSSSVAC